YIPIQLPILTAHNKNTPQPIPKQLPIHTLIPHILPQQKPPQITKLHQQPNNLAMVRDRLNHAPPLLKADIPIAIA
ncbi:hypothetical protein, partial [Staphylococcus aureus]|uniref:hypothetical protein n=1 Tax=Staphylococcus aureus TaxID=1280 RepID=UPI001C92EF60